MRLSDRRGGRYTQDMSEMLTVLPPQEALRRYLQVVALTPPGEETVGLDDALGRVVSRDLLAPENLPPFPRATMDGYAVRARDTFGASEGSPAYLQIVGDVPMGVVPTVSLLRDQVVRIATGGYLPEGADAVVMVELTQLLDDHTVEIVKSVAPGESVAQVGEDIRAGELLIAAGQRLRPWDVGALAGLGILEIPVFRRPKVAVISSGNEVVDPRQTPAPGQIRDINSYSVAAMVAEAGGEPRRFGIVPDEESTIRDVLHAALDWADLVLISGGSSVGVMDLTVKVIDELGPPGVVVHGVSVRPGKPTILAGGSGKPIVGLPGQPVSALIIFDLIVSPILDRMTGRRTHRGFGGTMDGLTVPARMARRLASAPGREDHVRVTLERRDGELWAVPVLGKSGSITTMTRSVGEVVIPLESEGIDLGEVVQVRIL